MDFDVALKQFYKDLWEWVEGGCDVNHPYFFTDEGHCGNLEAWYDSHPEYHGYDEAGCENIHELSGLIEHQFWYADLSATYPFNERDMYSYLSEARSGNIWKNESRLKWLKEHAQEV